MSAGADDDAPCRGLRSVGAPGDRVRLGFSVTDSNGAAALRLAPTALRSGSAAIAAEDIDVRIVSTTGALVADDRTSLEGDYVSFCGHVRHLHRLRHRQRFYRGPQLSWTNGAATSLDAGQRKPIFICVHVRQTAAPGCYEGAIECLTRHDSISLPLTIDVAPVALDEPPQMRMLWYLGTLDCRRPRHWVTERTFRAQLQDIRDHGFDAVSLHETERPLLRRACAIAREIGFSTIVLEAPYPDGFTTTDLVGLRLICYVSDEPDRRGTPMELWHRRQMDAAARLGAITFTSVTSESFTRRFVTGDLGLRPDLVSLYLPNNIQHLRAQSLPGPAPANPPLYYWLTNATDPYLHRMLTGVFLWKSGAAGVSPYCYQHLPAYPDSPWDDGTDADGERRQMATYPVSPGTLHSISTLRWEAMADGFTDLRYLTTVARLLDRTAHSIGPSMRRLRADVAERLGTIGRAAVGDTGFLNLTASGLEAMRRSLLSDAFVLQRALDGAPDDTPM